MNTSDVKAELVDSLSAMLVQGKDASLQTTTGFGVFDCTVENFKGFAMIRRNFLTDGAAMDIPFYDEKPAIQMMFSLNGQSAFNDRFDPFLLSPASHCLNFFKFFQCKNLLTEKSQQHDVCFRIGPDFYFDFIHNLTVSEDPLSGLILKQKNFNTINQNLPVDAGISGLLTNILNCPFEGEMKATFIREHIRALLTLQLYHFNKVLAGREIFTGERIGTRDRDILLEIRMFLDQNFLDAASIETLSKRFGINEFKLKHGFKMQFDTSPIRYVQQKRLEFAYNQLRDTNKTIKEIACEIGYTHAANFTAAFTKLFGNSPAYFRNGGRLVASHTIDL